MSKAKKCQAKKDSPTPPHIAIFATITKIRNILLEVVYNDIKFLHTDQTKFQMMSCMLKLNATVWQQKINTEIIGVARTCAQNGTEKDSQEGLKMKSSRQKETGKAKNDPEKNL